MVNPVRSDEGTCYYPNNDEPTAQETIGGARSMAAPVSVGLEPIIKKRDEKYWEERSAEYWASTLTVPKGYCVIKQEQIAALHDENAKLRAFAQDVMGEWLNCGILDNGDLQELAVKHGLLIPTHTEQPCGEECACLEYYGQDDFHRGEVLCYRKTQLLLGDEGEEQ